MKKWIAAILILVLLSQALPWTAFAAMGDMITESELRRAMSLAGLRFESAVSGDDVVLRGGRDPLAEILARSHDDAHRLHALHAP